MRSRKRRKSLTPIDTDETDLEQTTEKVKLIWVKNKQQLGPLRRFRLRQNDEQKRQMQILLGNDKKCGRGRLVGVNFN
jgi:hypothetical protein